MLRLRLCEEAQEALTVLKLSTDDTVTTIINNAILDAYRGKELNDAKEYTS